ncbi:MAG: SpoIIE family protein phosphatase [Anaerolineales bacterium]|nr:SpoIIE family protein phosphatase [Anaerolineales bacterium]MCB8953966.1 SpoIIE family protein phosphatase [Ardenticatenales bacterium]
MSQDIDRIQETVVGMPASPEDRRSQSFMAQAVQAEQRGEWEKAAGYYRHVLDQRAVELALINSVQQGLSSKYEMQAIYDLVGDQLRDTFNAQVVMISQYDAQTERIYHHYAIERGQHLQIPGWHPIDVSRARVVRTKKPLMINQAEINDLLGTQKMAVVPGTEVPKTWLGVPLMVGDEARGIVSLQNLDIENAFSPSDIALLMALTNSMSQSLENARLFNETQRLLNQMESEMELARQAQKSILPTLWPRHPGYDFGSLIIPARAVGGDFYDVIPLDNQRLCIVIGDVSDKGLPAALFMAVTFSLVRVETGRTSDQRELLQNVNRFLLRMNAQMFVTLLYCVLDYETGRMSYSRAGHLPPIVLEQQGKFVKIPVETGQPLGLFDNPRIDQQQCTIPKGGLALLFSDGLYEAVDAAERQFGLDRVGSLLMAHRHENAEAICDRLWLAVQAYSGEAVHQDDFTTVIVKRTETPSA